MHCILNFTSHVYNFVNKYKQSDMETEPLILPAQRTRFLNVSNIKQN